MARGYTIKIGGTPAAPGNVYGSASVPRYGRGISKPGYCVFDLNGLNGRTEPAEGDYVQVVYENAAATQTVVWDGFVREVKRELDDIVRHVVASDGLGILDKRDLDTALSWTATAEGTIAADILNNVGITAASSPIRSGTLSAGNNINYRAQYLNALKALRALAMVYGRELIARNDPGVAHRLDFITKAGDYSASQATWRAARDLVPPATLQTDDWEKADVVKTLGQGDGTSAASTYGGTSAGAGNNKAVFAAKTVNDATVAGALAQTLKDAYGDSRKIVVCPTRFFNLEVDQGIAVGDRITVQDYEGNSIGDFRVYFLECDPLYTDGWYTRVTLVRARNAADTAEYPALPSISDGQGVTMPGFADAQAIMDGYLTHQQITDLQGPVLSFLGEISRVTKTADNTATQEATVNLTDRATNNLDFLVVRVICAKGGDADWLVEVAVSDNDTFASGNRILISRFWLGTFDPSNCGFASASDEEVEMVFHVPAADLAGITIIKSGRVRVGTTSGAGVDLEIYASFDVIELHRHN